jgi:ABC-type glycerol-3-phosphate transport system permease component
MNNRFFSIFVKVVIMALLILLGLSTLLPYILMISFSFMAEFEMYRLPPKLIPDVLRWENYVEMWQSQPWGRYIFNTY